MVEDGVIIPGEPEWRVEAGRLEEVHVPPTLTGVLQARLDGLPEEERRALQGASVIGRVFWDQVLAYINGSLKERITDRGIEEVLDELRSRELIFRREASTFAEAREHIFKHALLREVTYESVLKRVRKAYHALVAEWLIEHTGDREGEFTGLIADHLELAGSHSQASHYLLQAGKQAAEKFANREAINYLSRALNLTDETDSEARYEILREREQVYDLIGNREAQEADLAALESLADAKDDRTKQAESSLLLARYSEQIDDYPSSLQAAQRAVRIAREIGDLEQEAAGHLAWGRALLWQHDLDQAKKKLEKALELAQDTGDQQLVGHSLRSLGIFAGYQDNFPLAIKYHQDCLALYKNIGDRISEIKAQNNLGAYFFQQAEFVKALENHEKTLATSREIGHKGLESSALFNLGEIYKFFGEYDQAWDSYQQCLSINRQLKSYLGITDTLFGLAGIPVTRKEYDLARKLAEEGLTIAREYGSWAYECGHQMYLGMAFIGLEKWSEAEALLKKSLDLLIQNDAQVYNLWRWAGLAHLYLAQGILDKAIEQADLILTDQESNKIEIRDYYSFYPLHACCQVLQAANDPRYPQVVETYLQKLAGKISDEDMRSSFLNTVPYNRGIIEMWEAEQEKNP